MSHICELPQQPALQKASETLVLQQHKQAHPTPSLDWHFWRDISNKQLSCSLAQLLIPETNYHFLDYYEGPATSCACLLLPAGNRARAQTGGQQSGQRPTQNLQVKTAYSIWMSPLPVPIPHIQTQCFSHTCFKLPDHLHHNSTSPFILPEDSHSLSFPLTIHTPSHPTLSLSVTGTH